MAWIAREDIDVFKKGNVVPDEKAEAWAQMYKVSPVEFVKDEPKVFAPVAFVKDDVPEKEIVPERIEKKRQRK
jgi:hypothetical protein